MPDERPRGAQAPTAAAAALNGLCPRCGAKTLFKGWATFADTCAACGLAFSSFNVGDGPAAFLTLILGTIEVALAVVIQLQFSPLLWVQIVIWVPVTAVLVLGSLRIAKALLIWSEYRNHAGEGRSRGPDA